MNLKKTVVDVSGQYLSMRMSAREGRLALFAKTFDGWTEILNANDRQTMLDAVKAIEDEAYDMASLLKYDHDYDVIPIGEKEQEDEE